MDMNDHGMHDMHDHDMHMDHHDHGMMAMDESTDLLDDLTSMAAEAANQEFCRGGGTGMVMYMDGFHWALKQEDTTCLNFFVPGWTLDTKPKFVLAMICVLIMGVLTEGMGKWKHQLAQQQRNNITNTTQQFRVLQACLQGGSLLLAYLLMLVVMTYSLELLSCVVLGLMIGYYVFDGDTFRQTNGGGTLCCSFVEEDGANAREGRRETEESLTEALLSTNTSGSTTDDNSGETNGHSCCDNTDTSGNDGETLI